MKIKDKLDFVDEVDSRFNKLLRAFVFLLVVGMVIGKLIGAIFSGIDWGFLMHLLPDWLIPDVLQDIADKVMPFGHVAPSSSERTVMPDGTVIDEKGIRFPFKTEGDEE